MKFRIPLIVQVVLPLILALPFTLSSQIFSTPSEKNSAFENIEQLHQGTLIVPLIKHSNKISMMKEMVEDPDVSENSRGKMEKKLEEELSRQSLFNQALIEHFSMRFDFCKVLFIDNDQLSHFDPKKALFINPESQEIDPEISIQTKAYFILRYFKSSGVASDPEEVRSFRIADAAFEVLQHPFPSSPDRQTSFRLRFRDLLNLSLNTNETIKILVVKLNESLHRYLIG
jgi:hypothetical protein